VLLLAACAARPCRGDRIAELAARLKDPDAKARRYAVDALGRMHDPRAVEPLIGLITDPDRHLRAGVANALGLLGDERAVEPLTTLLKDPHHMVRFCASRALRRVRR